MTRLLPGLAAALGLGLLAACLPPPGPPDIDQVAPAARETYTLAEGGDPVAQTVLGTMFEAGIFGQPDYRAAAQWYDRAVQQGDPLAAFYLASLFERGAGVSRDYLSAANLYRRAARAGNAAAAFKLGFLYEKGLGVERDFAQARTWYDSARSGWIMQGFGPLQPTYVIEADASPEEVQALIDAARRNQPNLVALPVAQAAPPAATLPGFTVPVISSETAPPPEPAPAAPPEPEAPAVASAPAGYQVHLASEKSVEAAMADWQALRQRYPDLLGALTPALATLDLGSAGTYYQLLAGPLGGEADADILCARLQPQGQYCTPVLPQG